MNKVVAKFPTPIFAFLPYQSLQQILAVRLKKTDVNKIKVIKRRCYGILNVDHWFQRIYLDMEGYSLFT